jgi:hypothetical protein
MTRDEINEYIAQSEIVNEWHWFSYHFQYAKVGLYTRFGNAIINSMLNIDSRVDGYAKDIIKRISSICGKEKFLPHYEQLLQICGELYVFNQAINYFKNCSGVEFIKEPHTEESYKNPEFIIKYDGREFGVEVKQPSLVEHINKRAENPIQLTSRVPGLLQASKKIATGNENITLPRDNPIKDFLISADQKFESFKKNNSEFTSILFILWDEFILEPVSALTAKPAGLFTKDSFAKDSNGESLKFKNVDYVFLDSPVTNFIRDSREEVLLDGKLHSLDYGLKENYPFKVFMNNPFGSNKIEEKIIDCFQVLPLREVYGAEYAPTDMIMWFPIK